MKRALTLISCLPVFIFVQAFSPSTPSDEPIRIEPKPNKPIKPHDASGSETVQDIYCSYSHGVITLTFTEPEGMAKVYIHDMGAGTALPTVHTISTASTAHIAVPTAPGFYRITITTSPGNEYEGFYTVF